VPFAVIHRVDVRFAHAGNRLWICSRPRQQYVSQGVSGDNTDVAPTYVAEAKAGTVAAAELIFVFVVSAEESTKLPGMRALYFRYVILESVQASYRCCIPRWPDRREVAVVLQAAPHVGMPPFVFPRWHAGAIAASNCALKPGSALPCAPMMMALCA